MATSGFMTSFRGENAHAKELGGTRHCGSVPVLFHWTLKIYITIITNSDLVGKVNGVSPELDSYFTNSLI